MVVCVCLAKAEGDEESASVAEYADSGKNRKLHGSEA